MTHYRAERFGNGPIIHPGLAESIGTNINGPSAIRVPGWVKDPLGRYYLYFADHRGDHIRLAYADDIAGPWRIYTPGTLWLADSGFPTNPSELDPPPGLLEAVAAGDLRPHIASPDVHVDNAARQIIMHFHGLTRNCSQITCRAVSADGLEFRNITPTGADFYARVFSWRGATYAAALEGWLFHSPDGGRTFPERVRFADRSIRHVAVFVHDRQLNLVYSRIGDSPERLLSSRVQVDGHWQSWKALEPEELLRPHFDWEGGDLPAAPSRPGPADTPKNQLRDPCVLCDGDDLWLFYSCAGETGIGLARLLPR